MDQKSYPIKNHCPIRFGIICKETTFPTWQAQSIQKLIALDDVEPALLIKCDDSSEITKQKTISKFQTRGRF